MFPRHVRWYRLLLLLLVIVNSDEAIAKTDSNLNLDTGSGLEIACPASTSGSSSCTGVLPPMQASFSNSISDGDISAFGLIGGSITGTPCGEVIILGIETSSGLTITGCNFVTRQFLIYEDANNNGLIEFSEFVATCSVQYIYGIQALSCDPSTDIVIDCNDTSIGGPTINDLVSAEIANCSAALEAGSTSPDGSAITVTNNFSSITYTGSGTNQDLVFTLSDNEGNTIDCTKTITLIGDCPVALNCDPISNIVVNCNDASPTTTVTALIETELANCAATLEAGSTTPNGETVTVTNNFSAITYTGSGTTQDVIFTVSDNLGNTIDCTKSVTIQGMCAIGLNCTAANDILIDCTDAALNGTTISALINTEITTCTAALEDGSTSPDGGAVTVTNNYSSLEYSGSGTTQEIIFTITDNEGTSLECTKTLTISGDCKFITCPTEASLYTCEQGVPDAATSFQAFAALGGVYDFLACDALTISSSDDLPFEDLYFCDEDNLEIIRTYTLTDDCGESFSCSTTIAFTSHTGSPLIYCAAESTVNVNATSCTYQATLTPPFATSSCSVLEIESVTSQYPNNVVDLEAGQHIIVWTATNVCGESSVCQQTINVVGSNSELTIICNGSQLAFLESNALATVPAESFVDAVYDACGSSGPYVYQIRRLSPGQCYTGNGSIYGPSIDLCCEDIGNVIAISIRVTDVNGNQAICTAQVEARDLIQPTLTSCPADMNVACTTNVDLADLSAFGVASASDNCPNGLSITETVVDNREDCGLGEIIRTFTISDLSDNTITCSQTLTVFDNDQLEEDDIVWPADNTYTNLCNEDIPTPADAGVPTYPTNFCSQPLATFTDQTFVEGPGCITVSRTWVVMDWCQFDADADQSTYRWEHTQVLNLQNNISPVFDNCETAVETCGNESTCMGMINITRTATDDCATADELKYAYTLTLESGTIINGTGNSINEPYPYGDHSIVWAVNDQCGNFTTCAQSIHIKDCKAPNAICLSGININLNYQGGTDPIATIWAKDLNVSSSDNCTATEDLEYAFDVDFTQQSLNFTCADAGTSSIVRMYVRDGDGNVGFCKTTIGIQDNFSHCPTLIEEGGEVMIAGRIATESNLTLKNVDVMLQNSEAEMHYFTDQNGNYAFENLPIYNDFNLTPSLEDEILNGISTADILHIQRHILSIKKLDSPYKIIAADVNNSETISGTDIIELRKVILGKQSEFTQSAVWRFVDPTTGLSDPEHPFPYNENMSLTELDYNAYHMDFVGVKTGDVNYSALINGFIPETISFRSQETLRLTSESLEGGSIQLTVNNDQALSGFQLAFRISGSIDQFNLSSSVLDIEESNYAIEDDIVKISWSTPEAIQLTKGQVLFSLNMDENADYELLYDYPMFETEAYDASVRTMDVEINIENSLVNEEWQVFRNTPNPFVDFTSIPFTAPRVCDLTLSIYDVNGKLLFQQLRTVNEGYQKWELSARDLGNVYGVLYYRLESNDFSSTHPFIRLK